MCGIAGLVAAQPVPDLAEVIGRMTACLRHRGPDDEAHWLAPDGAAALGPAGT